MMFVHIAPEPSSYGESTSSLKFGSRVSEITLGQAKKNVEAVSALDARDANVRPPLPMQLQLPLLCCWSSCVQQQP
jgi:hypothetical protein